MTSASLTNPPSSNFTAKLKQTLYLKTILTVLFLINRAALRRLRISAHCLEIERGRYGSHNTKNSIPREHRLCRYCNEVCKIEKIESEEHVLQDCPLYYKSRMEFQTKCRNVINASNRGTTEPAREDDVQNTDNEIKFFLSKFCHKIFQIRKAFLDYLDDYTD